jgi:hypothetical protein
MTGNKGQGLVSAGAENPYHSFGRATVGAEHNEGPGRSALFDLAQPQREADAAKDPQKAAVRGKCAAVPNEIIGADRQAVEMAEMIVVPPVSVGLQAVMSEEPQVKFDESAFVSALFVEDVERVTVSRADVKTPLAARIKARVIKKCAHLFALLIGQTAVVKEKWRLAKLYGRLEAFSCLGLAASCSTILHVC